MTNYDVKRLALIEAEKARLEAMKIENKIRLADNLSPAFGFKDFMEVSGDLENLAHAHDEQL